MEFSARNVGGSARRLHRLAQDVNTWLIPSGAPLGLALDALNPRAFDHYWRDVVTPLLDAAKPYIGTSLRYLVTDVGSRRSELDFWIS